LSFYPFLGLRNPKWQTILGAKLPSLLPEPPTLRKHLILPDGDTLALEISTPTRWQCHNPTVVMLHGLGGSHRSSYLVRLTHKLFRKNIQVIRVNFRGCGSGKGLAKGIYHAGRSEDVDEVLRFLHHRSPQSPISLVGFSLGGNVALKLAGELSHGARHYLQKVIAVSPPVDLMRCANMMAQPQNEIFRKYYLKRLWRTVHDRHVLFPEFGPAPTAKWHYSFWEFDNEYTSIHSGYANAEEYYTRCSALPLIPEIQIPCKILFAEDDPFVDAQCIQKIALPTHIEVKVTPHGGHMGFLAMPGLRSGIRWLDNQIIQWLI
jgi:predicted alpha/beta-fold hydrolase